MFWLLCFVCLTFVFCLSCFRGHSVLCKDVLSFVSQTFDVQVLCFGFCVLCPVFLIERVAQPRC